MKNIIRISAGILASLVLAACAKISETEAVIDNGTLDLCVELEKPEICTGGKISVDGTKLDWDGTESIAVIFAKSGEDRTRYIQKLDTKPGHPGVFEGTINLGSYTEDDIIGYVYPYNEGQCCGEYYKSSGQYRISFFAGCDNSKSNDSGATVVEQHQSVAGLLNGANLMMVAGPRQKVMQPAFCNIKFNLYGKHADGVDGEKIKKVSMSTPAAPHVGGRFSFAVDKTTGQTTGALVVNAKQYPVTTVLDTPAEFGASKESPASIFVTAGARFKDGSDENGTVVNNITVTVTTDKAVYTKSVTNAGFKLTLGHILPVNMDIASFSRTASGEEEKELPKKKDDGYIRILAVGNSWSKCAIRHITDIASLCGKKVIVGHGYLGGSGLEDQYYGIDNLKYSFNHDGVDEVVHSAYQYWKYTSTGSSSSYVKNPADDTAYGNGKKGIGVTLESVVTDEPWDIMILQPSGSLGYSTTKVNDWQSNDGNRSKFSLLNLVNRIKEMMDESVSSTIKVGMMVPWAYPAGNKGRISSIASKYSSRISGYTGSQADWDQMFEYMHQDLQSNTKTLNEHIGGTYLVNVGLAIYNARQHPEMLRFGYNMQVDKDDTHLADGMPKFVASLMYCYEILGLKDSDIKCTTSSAPTRSDAAKSTKEYDDYNNAIINTVDDKKLAVYVSWEAQNGITESGNPAITSVTTEAASSVTKTGATINGSFTFIGTTDLSVFSCGFEYKENGAEQWTSVTCSPTTYSFSKELTGLTEDKEYTFRAWAKDDSKTVYGKEVNFLTSDKLILTPTFTGLPTAQAYDLNEPDATKSGTYTYTQDGKTYEFFFYGKKQKYSNKYNLYYGTSSGHIMFGAAGSYILLPAVEGKKLVAVTISIYKATKSWSVTTKEGVGAANTDGAPSGGESHSFSTDGEKYTFNLSGTENNTSYALRNGNATSGIKLVEIVYQ